MAVIISCQHVSMRYDTHLTVRDVSFDVETGDYLCIAGENGAGKSTLMRGILGLMKPTEGHIRFDGIKHTEIGYMPQQTTIQKDFPASVSEVVLSGRLNRRGIFPFYTKKDKSYAHTIMEQWGVAELRKKSYAELSIGQRQRVLLARALCADEKVIMLDEPVSGLDPVGAFEMYHILQCLNRDRGVTVVMISHDVKRAAAYGNKILHMHSNTEDISSLLFFGSTQAYMETEFGRKVLDC